MSLRLLERAFSAGELTPELYSRFDLSKVQEGLAYCRNFITLPHGPAVNRPGTEFVQEVKNSSVATRVIPFSYNNTQTFVIQIGAGYFRWHTNASTLLYTTPAAWSSVTAYSIGSLVSNGGINYYCRVANTNIATSNTTYWYAMPTNPNIYEIPNSYAAADLMDIHYVQSADVLTLVHPNYPPIELRRYGATNWQVSMPTFVPPVCQLTSVAVTATTGTGTTSYQYVVTGVTTTNLEETVASSSATCTNDLTVSPNKNTVTWTDSSPAGTYVRYNVYRLSQGIYGYVGQAGSTSFIDQNIAPDVSKTPPIYDTLFTSSSNYPAAVSYFEQRRVFAGTLSQPQNLWMTKSATESNMSYSIPVRDDNRIAIRIAAREASAIRHIVPVGSLLLMTASCEWRVTSINSDAITPTSINVRPQSYIGANNVSPIVIGNVVLFAAARGGHIREMSYSYQASGYLTSDISIMAPHLFDYNTIIDMAYSRGPIPILWAVSSTGNLLGMTYQQEHQIAAWHHHDTGNGDVFESICTITENNEDMLYCVIRRTINGSTKRYIERLHTRLFATLSDSFFVDCGATYNGTATMTVTGLSWLEGMTVNILADGAVSPQQVVTSGTITLPVAASKITVGLPITADLQTLPVAAGIDNGYGQGRPKNVNKIFLRTYRSSGIYAGPSFTNLRPYRQRTTEVYGSPPNLISDEVEISLDPAWGSSGQVCVRQSDPLPLDLASMTLEIAVGGG